jgi:hypothetical protein
MSSHFENKKKMSYPCSPRSLRYCVFWIEKRFDKFTACEF